MGCPQPLAARDGCPPTQSGKDGGREGAKGRLFPEGFLQPQGVITALSQQPQGQEGVQRGEPG